MKGFLTGFILICFLNCKNQISNLPENSETISQNEEEKRIKSKFLSEEKLKQFVISSPPITIEEKLPAPFDTLKFNKVIAYEYQGSEEPYPSVFNKKGKFIPIVEKQKSLSEFLILDLVQIISAPESYGDATAACFNSRLSFVFYEDSLVKGVIDICLDCNYLESNINIPAFLNEVERGKKLGHITYGFSGTGIAGIKELSKELDFYYKSYESQF